MNKDDMKPMEYGGILLVPGKSYQVTRQFRDYDSKLHEPGEKWEYLGCNIFPYDSGHTIYIKTPQGGEDIIRMQYLQDAQEKTLEHFSEYVEECLYESKIDPFFIDFRNE